jgi:hypothetical protein
MSSTHYILVFLLSLSLILSPARNQRELAAISCACHLLDALFSISELYWSLPFQIIMF